VAKEDSYIKQFAESELSNPDYLMSSLSNFSQESKLVTFIEDARGKFSNLLSRAVGFFTSQKIGNFKPVTVIPGKVTEQDGADAYRLNAGKTVSIPMGFKGWYIDYVGDLESALSYVETLGKSVKMVNEKLAMVLHEPDMLKAQSTMFELARSIPAIPDGEYAKLVAYTNNHGKSAARLGDVVGSMSDLDKVYQKANVLNQRCGRVDFAAMDKNIKRMAELIQAVQKQIESSTTDVSGGAASALSAVIYGVAMTANASIVVVAGITELSNCLGRYPAELA